MRRKRSLFAVVVLCMLAAACRESAPRKAFAPAPQVSASAPAQLPLTDAAAPDAAAVQSFDGLQTEKLLTQLAACEVTIDHFARRVLYTWTTEDQIEALRKSPVLLTRTESPIYGPSGFDKWLQSKADDGDALAKVLRAPRYRRTRHAWPNPWATSRGLNAEQYGSHLLAVTLKEDAWIVTGPMQTAGDWVLGVAATSRGWIGQDIRGAQIEQAELLAHPERIAAVYFVSEGTEGQGSQSFRKSLYREYVLLNESRVESFAYATPEIDANVTGHIGKLRNWITQTPQFYYLSEDPGGHPTSRHNLEFVCHAAWWRRASEYPTVSGERPTAAAGVGFARCLAFPTLDYAPNPSALNAVIGALEARGRGAPLTHTVDAAKLAPSVLNPRVRPAARPATSAGSRGSFGRQ
jgi:hypothetical protein